MTVDNVQVAVMAKVFEGETDTTERWYGTKYKSEPIAATTLEKWRTAAIDPGMYSERF